MKNHVSISHYQTPVGELILGSFEDKICLCDWRHRSKREAIDKRVLAFFNAEYSEYETPIIEKCKNQLSEYFDGKRKLFDIPLLIAGSEFQIKVWKNLIQIPFGETVSYLELSQQIKNEKAIRAVAAANGANAISILIPCHRIIGSNGSLVGYAGGLKAKKQLLILEDALIQDQLSLF